MGTETARIFAALAYASPMFDTILGLPAHPLIVHAPVVLLPLTGLGILALVFRPAWRQRFATALLGLLALGSLASGAAVLSGKALASHVGLPSSHQSLGTATMIAAFALLAIGGPWLWLVRRDTPVQALGKPLGIGAAALAVTVLVLTMLTGHSGATAAWGDRVTATTSPSSQPTTSPSPQPTGSSASPAPTTDGHTLAEVAEHNAEASCWAAIDGGVYDLTAWIQQHPGGSQRILDLCGTDATTAFARQHDGQERPETQLASMRIGDLIG